GLAGWRRWPIEIPAAIVGNVARRCVLAELQRALVRDNRPAVLHGDLRRVVLHRAETVRHHVEKVAGGGVPEAILHERRRLAHAALHDDAVALPRAAVARRAEDVVALAPAREHRGGDRHRELVRERAVDLPRVEQLVAVGQRVPRHRVRDRHARGLAVVEEGARLERLVSGRIVHVLTTSGGRERRGNHDDDPRPTSKAPTPNSQAVLGVGSWRLGIGPRQNPKRQLRTPPADEGPAETTRWRGDRTSDPWTRCRERTGRATRERTPAR